MRRCSDAVVGSPSIASVDKASARRSTASPGGAMNDQLAHQRS
jgi:hypothetical protein